MKRKWTDKLQSFIALTVLTGLLLPSAAVFAAEKQPTLPNNASAIVARGEDAFMKSSYEFSANWIWNPTDNNQGNRWMIFRKDVELSEVPERVTAKIAADTKYWLYINGEMAVYEGQLKRGAALLKKDIYTKDNPAQPNLNRMLSEVATYYDEVDLTPYLKKGKNTIVALVWYFGNEGHSHVGSGKGGFLFESQMGDELVISDSGWKTSRHMGYQPSSPIGGYAQEYHIIYDARKGFDDFASPDYDVSGWQNACEIGKAGDKPWNELWPRSIPQWKVWDLANYSPDDTDFVTKLSATKYRLKLPSNIQFTPFVKVKAPAGKVIKMSSPNSGTTSVTYTTKGGADGESVVQSFESLTWINWWFVEFEIPAGVEVLELGYRQSGYNTEFDGSFVSDDEFFNTLWIKARDTAYVNIRDTFMDCPDRERAPWLGDAVNEMQIAYYSMSPTVYDAVRKDIATRINWQNTDGIIPSTAPATFRYNEYAELTGQSLAGVMSWFEYYLWSGDIETLRAAYPALQAYMATFDLDMQNYTDPFIRGNGTNTMHLNWIDWGPNMDQHLALNIWAYIGVDTLCKFAEALGDAENLANYTALRESMKSKFDAMFWNGKEYRSATYTGAPDDRGQALAVYAGLATPDKYPIIRDLLMKHQYASPYMVKYSIEALYLMGYTAEAEQRMKESYKNDVPLADPTFSESWGGGGSKNHGWSGGGLIVLSGYAAGVRPLEAGFAKYTVIPQMASIKNIAATIPTGKGNINVNANKGDGRFDLTVNVLAGSTALIGIPRLEGATKVVCRGKTVWQNGYAIDAVKGLTYSHTDENFIYFEAAEGDWSLSALPADVSDKGSYTLEIPAIPGGSITVNGETVTLPYAGKFDAGSQITVKAIADEGYLFDIFAGSIGSREKEITLTIDSDLFLTAEFEKNVAIDGVFLTVGGFTHGGRLEVGGKAAPGAYRQLWEKGSTVTVKAIAEEEYRFVAWRTADGKILTNDPEYTLTLDQNTQITAVFLSVLGENLADGKKVTVSSTVNNHMFAPEKLTDGIYTVTGQNEGWTSLENSNTQWFSIDLGKAVLFDTVKLYPRHNGTDNGYGIPVNVEILVSQDGKKWTKVATFTDLPRLDSGTHTLTFAPQTARFVKVNGTKLRKNPYDGDRTRFQVAEVEVYHVGATSPDAPVIETQPISVDTQKGKTVRFFAFDISKTEIRYQWLVSKDGGVSWTAIEGATDSAYTFKASAAENGWQFVCELTNDKGTVRSDAVRFTLISENYALKQPYEVSTSQTVGSYFHASYINDGVSETKPTVNEGWTSNESSGRGEWVTIDMGSTKTVSRVVLYPRYDGTNDGYGIPEGLAVKVSADNKNWKTVYKTTSQERPTAGAVIIDFDAVEARYVKVEGTKLRENPGDGNRRRMQIAELEIYNVYPETKSDEQETPAPAPGDPSDPSVETPAPAPNAGKPAGLSAGAIAGIAIGAAVLLTAGIAAAVVIGKKNAKKQ